MEVYPYAENYTFISLSDLNNYLKANRHLPNLPGKKLTGQVDSAEIDRLLLEKTEEQAIYIIELNEEMRVLKRENEALKQLICPQHPTAEICNNNKLTQPAKDEAKNH